MRFSDHNWIPFHRFCDVGFGVRELPQGSRRNLPASEHLVSGRPLPGAGWRRSWFRCHQHHAVRLTPLQSSPRPTGKRAKGYRIPVSRPWLAVRSFAPRVAGVGQTLPAQSVFWKVRSCSHCTSGLPGEGMPPVKFRGEIIVSFTNRGRVRGSSHLCDSTWPSAKLRFPAPL